MMYVRYPSLDRNELLAGLQEVDLGSCCAPLAELSPLAVRDFTVEMFAGSPVLRATLTNGSIVTVDIASGTEEVVDLTTTRDAGMLFARTAGLLDHNDIVTVGVEQVDVDQWTVNGSFNRHRPMQLFENDEGTRWYVSGTTGEVVQYARKHERAWNWLGAVTHWLYLTPLRQHTVLWSNVVIWLTIVSTFLTLTGLYLGFKRFAVRRAGPNSPYTGFGLWHHYAGLVFGVFTLTWLVSGFVSMNPWGTLETRDFSLEWSRYGGSGFTLGQVTGFVDSLQPVLPAGTLQIRFAPVDGDLYATAVDRHGTSTRLAVHGPAAPITLEDATAHAKRMRPDVGLASTIKLNEGDAYYYAHHDSPVFPVLRITYDDGERFYMDPMSGRLVKAVDASTRSMRWWFAALHKGDFHRLVRMRPVWDGWMLLLLVGSSVGVLTGTFLGMRRLLRSAPGS